MVVQHNISAMNANRYFGINNSGLAKSLEKLSSGYAINRAGDNAAGLAVSEKMRSQIAGLTQGVKNAQDGISMVQTFEGALTETDAILQRMKTLATQAANGSYQNEVDRDAIQLEYDQLNDELNQIADTDFNGVVVLNGGQMADGLKQVDGRFDYSNKASQAAAADAEMLAAAQEAAQKDIDAAQEVVDSANQKVLDAKNALSANPKDLSNNGSAKGWETVSNNNYDSAAAEKLFGAVNVKAEGDAVDRSAGGAAAGWAGLGNNGDGTAIYGKTQAEAIFDSGATATGNGIKDADGNALKDAKSVTVTFEYDKANDQWTAKTGVADNGDGTFTDVANLTDVFTDVTPDAATGTGDTAVTGLGGFTVTAGGNVVAEAVFDSSDLNHGDTVTLTFDNVSTAASSAPVSASVDVNISGNGMGILAGNADTLKAPAAGGDAITKLTVTKAITNGDMDQELKDALDMINGGTISLDLAAGVVAADTNGVLKLTTATGDTKTSTAGPTTDTLQQIKLNDKYGLVVKEGEDGKTAGVILAKIKADGDVDADNALLTFKTDQAFNTDVATDTVSFKPDIKSYSYVDPNANGPKVTAGTNSDLDFERSIGQEGAQSMDVTFKAAVSLDGTVSWIADKASAVDANGNQIDISNIDEVLTTTTQSKDGNSGEGGFKVYQDGKELANAVFDATQVKNGDTVTLTFTKPEPATMAPTNGGTTVSSQTISGTNAETLFDSDTTANILVNNKNMSAQAKAVFDLFQGAEFKVSDKTAGTTVDALETLTISKDGATKAVTSGTLETTANYSDASKGKKFTLNGVDAWIVADKSTGKIKVGTVNATDNGMGTELFEIDTHFKTATDQKGNVGTKQFSINFSKYAYDPAGAKPTIQAGMDKAISGMAGETAKLENAYNSAVADRDAALEKLNGLQEKYPTAADDLKDNVSVSDAYDQATAPLTYTDHIALQTGARSKDLVDFTFKYSSDGLGDLKANMNCSAREDGLGTAGLSLRTQKDANYAIDRIDNAINKVSMVRATFGATQNRLEHKIDNMNVTKENITSAESRIRDTNMAEEMTNFTKNQILSQASQAMLAQANQLPQGVLQLLG